MVDARTIAKTTIPGLTRAISRPRLIQRIAAAGSATVIVINGQAAQGKSTLAAEIAHMPGPACAWMHLDPSDSDPMNLFRLLVHALKTALPDVDVSAFLKNPSIAMGPTVRPERTVELAGALVDQIVTRAPVRIVMDGLDELTGNPYCLMLVERIRAALCPPGSLILVSRETPSLKLESLRIHQELIELTNADLAFSHDEIFRFFMELYALPLGQPQLATIHAITDGWAGGLVLVWEALRHLPEDQQLDFIDNGLPAAMQGERLAYFSEAIFSGLDERLRSVLIRSAIFDTLDAQTMARCMDDVSETDAEDILNTMVRQNGFILPLLGAKPGWRYRFNQLFRDFLLGRFNTTLDRQAQHALYARAADVAWDDGDFEGAIRFFIQAESYEKAAAGIKKIAMGLSAQGRFADLVGWIDRLPAGMIDDDAWLLFYAAMGRRISGGRRTIAAFARALDRFTVNADERGQLLASAYLIEAAVFIGHSTTEVNGWLNAAWTLLETVSGNRYYPFAKTVLWMQVAFGYLAVAGDLQKGLSACRNALLLANTIGDDTLTVNATIIHVFGLTLTGELAQAEKALAASGRLVAAAYPEYRALHNIVRMELALSKGDMDNAQRLLAANQADIDKYGLLFLYPIHVDLSGLLLIQQDRFNELVPTAQHLEDVATLTANPFYGGLAMRLRALAAYRQHDFKRARQWAGRAADVIARNVGESIHLFRCHLIGGLAAYHLGDLADARSVLMAAQTFFSRVSSHLSLVESRLGLALVETALGNARAADQLTASALDLAAAQGYDVFSILSAEDIGVACTPAIQRGPAKRVRLARRLVEHVPDVDATPADSETAEPPTTHRPKAIGGIQPDPVLLDIRTLGAFEVRRSDGEIISDRRWAGVRQKLLLKAIIVNGCREIPKDILMETIWPESDLHTASKRFKVTLHRLRRILEPDRDHRSVSSCIILKDQLVSLDMDRCRVDVNDFLRACDAIRQFKRDGDDNQCLAACRQAVATYGGDFLPEEPYLSRADMKRSALREQFVGVLMDMAVLFQCKNDVEQAIHYSHQAIQADPLAEQAYLQLMRLLRQGGRHSAAIRVYRDLQQRLAAELDTVPDPETTRVYEAIRYTRNRG